MLFTFKKITTSLVLLSFLVMALFSFAGMAYGPDGSMQDDCPFSNLGTSLCPPSALPGAIHHISFIQSFLNASVDFGIMVLIIALLIAASAAFIFSFRSLLHWSPIRVSYRSPPFTSQDRKIKRWLSLFENSPSI